MASSGYFNTNAYEGRYLQFSWTASQSIVANKTTISWVLKGAGTGNVEWYKAGNFSVVIDGKTEYSTSARITLYDGTIVASGSVTLEHNAEGTRSFTASVKGAIYTNAVNCTGSSTFTLDRIVRASQPSCVTYPNHTQYVGEFGDEISIHMNRQSSEFTHTVRYQFGTKSGTIATGVTNGVKWVVPLSLMDLLPAVTYGSGTIYVDTYHGSTKIGTKSCGFTAGVPASVHPTCEVTLEDITGVDDVYGSPVKGRSMIKATVTAKEAYSSPIVSCTIVIDGVKYSGFTAISGVLSTSGSSPVTVQVTDKRGRSDEFYYSMKVQDYTAPAVTALTAKRCNQDGTLNKRGNYVKVTFSAGISYMSGKNTAAYKVKYKKSSNTAYTTTAIAALANQDSVTGYSYIFAAEQGSSYDVMVEVTDRHSTAQRSAKVPTASAILSWRGFGNAGNKEDGLGIGKVPEKANTLQVGWDAEFDQTVIMKGNQYCFSSIGAESTDGYILMARITVTAANSDTPITFEFSRRKARAPMKVHICFASASGTDPDLVSCEYEGENYDARLTKSATSVWDLYVKKVSNSDTVTLNKWSTSYRQMKRVSIDFVGSIVSTVPNGLLGYHYKATPVKMRSILDYIYPVGSIYLAYNHTSPAALFGGTWERIENAFLWATTQTGTIGQTGGERTVTLTGAQIPPHNHGGTYTNAGTARTHAWLTSNGSAMGFDTVDKGGGEPHNNMPPYIQVSAWRRTE